MEHAIGKSLFEIFVNLHLIINKKEIKNYFPHFSLSRKLVQLSRKQDIDFGNQGVHMLMPVPSSIMIERGSDGGP